MALTGNLVLAIFAASLGAVQHGYNTGIVNDIQEKVEEWIEEKNEGSDKKLIYSIIVSVFCIGGMIGALSTAFVAERFGRKMGLFWNNIFVFIAAGLMGLSKISGSYHMIIIGRFFIGINSGLNSGLSPMYLTEISPVNLRGAIGTIYQLVVTISILFSFALPLFLGNHLWPSLFAAIIIPAIIMIITLLLCPESPKYLLVNQGQQEKAQEALTWLRGSIEVQDEMEEMKAEAESMKLVKKVQFMEFFRNKSLKQPLIIAVVVMLSQQLSGINAVIFYSTEIFRDVFQTNKTMSTINATMASGALISEDKYASYATLGIGVINVLMTIVSLILIERAGRRTLHLTGLGGMFFTTLLLMFCFFLKDDVSFLRYVSIFAVYLFVIMFATGPGSIPWFLVTELFEIGARAIATSIAVTINWTANFFVGLLFIPLKQLLGVYVFAIFSVLLAIFWLFTFKKVPETKGKPIEEISALFR